jgi:hypothetical protein
MKQRDTLKFNSPHPHTHDTTTRLQESYNKITQKINNKKTVNWKAFITTLNHTTNISKLYKTLNSITKSQKGDTTTHATIATGQHIPSYTEQANILVTHYANISHLGPPPTRRQTHY